MSRALRNAILLFLLVASAPAMAARVGVAAGISTTSSRDNTPAALLEVTGASRSNRLFTWQPTASVGFVGRRDVRSDLDRDVVIGGAGIRLVDWWRNAFFGTQIGYTDATTAALSSHVQFISSLGWQGDHHVILLRHISNADAFGGKNLGETMLLVGYTF